MEMANTDCVTDFGKGKFRYINTEYQDVKIKSRKRKQIKKTKDSKSFYKIEWISPCNYVLTYLIVSKPEYEYLIGQKIDVKIIGVLENGNYDDYSNLSNRTYGFGFSILFVLLGIYILKTNETLLGKIIGISCIVFFGTLMVWGVFKMTKKTKIED